MKWAACLFLLTFSLFSEETPDLEIVLEEIVPSDRVEGIRVLVVLDGEMPLYSEVDTCPCEGTIIAFSVPGNGETLASQLTPIYLNQPLTEEKIQELKQAIYRYYLNQGRPFILVQIPEQDMNNGVLQLRVVESRLGQSETESGEWSNTARLEQWTGLVPGEPINETKVLDGLRYFNKNPFHSASVIYAPGEEPLTTNVTIHVEEKTPGRIYAGGDNTGLQTTGRQRWFGGFTFGNVFWCNHLFSYQYTASADFHKFQSHTGQYMAFLPWKHTLNFFGGYSMVNANIAGVSHNSGSSAQASVRYTIPLTSLYRWTHSFNFGGDYKRTNNTVPFSEDPTFGKIVNLTQLMLSYTAQRESSSSNLSLGLEVFGSPGEWLPLQSNSAYNSLRPGAKNQWVYTRAYVDEYLSLPARFALLLSAEGQWASNDLLPSEQFGIGGYDSVRGYEERELNKDTGAALSVELHTPTIPLFFRSHKSQKDQLYFLGFVDYGVGTNHTPVDPLPKTQYLLSAGPGIRYSIPPYVNGRFDLGFKLKQDSLYAGGPYMIHFSLMVSY